MEGKHTISMTAKDDDAVDSFSSSSAKEQSERKGLGIHGESKEEYYRPRSMGHTQKHQPMARWMGDELHIYAWTQPYTLAPTQSTD